MIEVNSNNRFRIHSIHLTGFVTSITRVSRVNCVTLTLTVKMLKPHSESNVNIGRNEY